MGVKEKGSCNTNGMVRALLGSSSALSGPLRSSVPVTKEMFRKKKMQPPYPSTHLCSPEPLGLPVRSLNPTSTRVILVED